MLVIAQRLSRATPSTLEDATRTFLDHWDDERHHFRREEEILLPAFAAYGPPDHPTVTRILQDHMLIRRDAGRLAQEPGLALAHELGERLASHVRLEERELFPMIESTLPEAAMEELGVRLRAGADDPTTPP